MQCILRNFWNQSQRLMPRVPPPNNHRDLLKQIVLGSLVATYVSKRQTRA